MPPRAAPPEAGDAAPHQILPSAPRPCERPERRQAAAGTVPASFSLTILYMIYNFYLIITNKANSNELSKNTKILFFIMIFGIVLLIILSMFLTFTEVGSPYIVGIQSRYFIPLFFQLYL